MPVKDETDTQYDQLGATISRRFMDVSGKVETTCNPRPRIDQYAGDGRSALGDQMNYCANCEATETRIAEREAAIAAYAAQQVGDIEERHLLRKEIKRLEGERNQLANNGADLFDELKGLRAAVRAYVDSYDAEMNTFYPTIDQMESAYNAFVAMKAAAGIKAECKQDEGGNDEC